MKRGLKGTWLVMIVATVLFQWSKSAVDSVEIKADKEMNFTADTSYPNHQLDTPGDCSDIREAGFELSGVYRISINDNHQMRVFCDFDTPGGNWLVFQRRQDGSVGFYRNWNDYASGFGNVDGEFWLGNEILHQLTSRRKYKLRIDLEDFENQKRFAEYGIFFIGPSSDYYRLKIGSYSGDAGDAMAHHNNDEFSTFDVDLKDGGVGGCAKTYYGAWWYDNVCHQANLNGLYLRGVNECAAGGINWFQWHGFFYSLKTTEMKITLLD